MPHTVYLRFQGMWGAYGMKVENCAVGCLSLTLPYLFPPSRNQKVMRLYDKSVIYWRSTPGSDLPNSVPWHMIPVRPRHQMQPQPGDVAPTYTGGGGRKKIDHKVCFFVTDGGMIFRKRLGWGLVKGGGGATWMPRGVWCQGSLAWLAREYERGGTVR